MSIRHQVQNHLIEKFSLESKETIPELPVEILRAGDDWTTVLIHSESLEDEAKALAFITSFDELNN